MTKHLKEYLAYYQGLQKPGYAVLVTGDWGVGKTHQVRQCIEKEDCYYVSLFGLQTPSEAHAAVYAAYAPTLNKLGDFIGAAGDAAENVGGLISLGGAAADWLNATMRRNVEPDRTLIFDDLERCGMSLEQLMGVCSTYVEHLGFRVVLIADEKRLEAKHPDYRQAKEKVVGHTSKVVPRVSEAFEAFVANVDGASRDFIVAMKPEVIEIFHASNCKSLRVLRHVIFDLARLHQSLGPKQLENGDAMAETVGLFVACGIEARLGRLTQDDLKNRAGQRMGFEMRRQSAKDKDEVEQPPLVAADDRYPTIDLENQILDDQVLEDVFEHGVFDSDRIIISIERSPHFVEAKNLPPWRLVSSFDELPDEVFESALDTMNKQFENREITSSGEMLHMFALKLMMSDEGILEQCLDTTRDECLNYIEDLLAAGKLPPRELDWRWWDSFDRAYGGYGYWVRPTYQEQFKSLWDRLISAREEALEASFPAIVKDLLGVLAKDGIEFYRQVCHTAGRDSPYALIPVFKSISPAEFVEAWLAAPRPNWRWVKSALEDRLEPHRAQNELASELDWALGVLGEIEKRRDTLTGFERLRVERIIPKKLRQLEEVHEAEAVQQAVVQNDAE
ncbi:hypothetical protein [Ruegeria atlantica]|uniref:hypothetical protein n=1 Tax=Ruegeria atlantica TaxID=81569 RepID=UPI001481CBD2|nr:hypothetical protein [Ruegeria atlantica]